MITVNIRKQGGAAIITIPSDVLKMLNINIGSTLELDVTSREIIARPVADQLQVAERKRYTVAELSQGVTPKKIKELNKKTKWAREGKSTGRELP